MRVYLIVVINKHRLIKYCFESYCLSKVFIDRYFKTFLDLEIDNENSFFKKKKKNKFALF